jgi:hypothetical protein
MIIGDNLGYSLRIFNKDLRALSYDDVVTYFQEPREESEILEFKSGQGDFEGVFINNIMRTISAFLNSSGGLLIWGAPKEITVEKGKTKVCGGDLTPLTISKEKDHLINRISSAISYMPMGIRIEKLEKDGKFLYIFEIDESYSKPHQYNGIYYIRLDGQSKPAPHYIVDSLFKQIKFPEVEGCINFSRFNFTHGDDIFIDIEVYINNFSPFINEKNVSYRLVCTPGIFLDNNKATFSSDTIQLLHFGMPHRSTHSIHLSASTLHSKHYIFKIMLSINGELSPAKSSSYEFNLEKQEGSGKFQFKKNIISFYENKTFKERQDELGSTKKSFYETTLNR